MHACTNSKEVLRRKKLLVDLFLSLLEKTSKNKEGFLKKIKRKEKIKSLFELSCTSLSGLICDIASKHKDNKFLEKEFRKLNKKLEEG